MLLAVISKEWRRHSSGFRYLATSASALVLVTLATWITAGDYRLRLGEHQQLLAREEAGLSTLHTYSFLQPLALRPPEPLSILDQGVDAGLGSEVRVTLFQIPVRAGGGAHGNELMPAAFFGLDLTAVVRGVLGLLALLLVFDAVIEEKESGTLRLIFANAVSRRTVLAGKALGALLALLVPFVAGWLIALAILELKGGVELTGSQGLRLAGMFVSHLAYLGLLLVVGLLISLWAPSASAALALAVFLWLAIVWVVPGSAAALARDVLGPEAAGRVCAERAEELEAELDRKLLHELQRDPLRVENTGHRAPFLQNGPNRAVLRREGSEAYYASMEAYYSWVTEAGMDYAERVFAERRFCELELRRSARMAAALTGFSPAFLLDHLSMSFAGTSARDHLRFLEASRRYRLRLIEYLEANDALGTRRWFTDDPPDHPPWTARFGLAPEEVDSDNYQQLINRLSEPEIAEQRRRDLRLYNADPARRLELGDLPRFRLEPLTFWAALRRAGSALLLLIFSGWIGWRLALARFRRLELE